MSFDRLLFGIFYRVGFTPWEGHGMAPRLRELLEGPSALPKGRVLDVGAGTGDASIYLAQHGWEVTAVDFVGKALQRAAAKAAKAGVQVKWIRADVTRLSESAAGTGFSLIVDNGCLHGIEARRDDYVREITRAAAPGARLLLLAFPPGRSHKPIGISREEIERRFAADWKFLQSGEAVGSSNISGDPIFYYEFERRVT